MILRWTAYDLNNSLDVAAKFLDVTDPNNITAVGTSQMQPSEVNGTYFLSYSAPMGKKYLVNMMAYSDPGTWNSPNLTYTPGDAELIGGDGEACPMLQAIVGFVNQPISVIGFVNQSTNVVGFVNCDCD